MSRDTFLTHLCDKELLIYVSIPSYSLKPLSTNKIIYIVWKFTFHHLQTCSAMTILQLYMQVMAKINLYGDNEKMSICCYNRYSL